MSAHTPAPWRVVDGAYANRVPVVVDADGVMIARIPPGRPNAEPDARLIAAAPELYAVVRRWAQLLDDTGSCCACRPDEKYLCCLCQVTDAIDAAEGRE